MPLTRCLIRNEYGLGDPELYKVADKDDPEALLEGVAMAGLVGVLRQLGDLAQFAAEIFHDLHEEVMSTATRGHSLIVRVQQLEVEFPSVEKTLLSQTSHTAFLYNSGVDWHPNLRADQNLVIREDLPRFVMDSYEECRGPPRLFLLDKFDVAGAGASLKRYSDPSFFKVETTSSTGRKLEGQREKKIRRVKKRGLLGRNGDTPETFSSSHVKLHQLFLEESIEAGVYVPERRIKLKKRQFTGSLFDRDKGRSYMEKFLDTSPEQKIVHEKYIDPLPLTWTSENGCDSGLDIVEIGTVSPLKKSIQTDQIACSSPDTMGVAVKPSIDDFNEAAWVTDCNDENNADMILPAISKIVNGEESADGESKSEVGADHNSDDAASEIDNYIDARAFIDSEVETDSECKRNGLRLNLKPVVVESDTSEGKRELESYDALSVGNSITSEDGSNFFRERESSSCSVSMDTLAETTPDLGATAVIFPSASASNLDGDKMSADHLFMSEEIPGNKPEKLAAKSAAVVDADDCSKSVQEICEVSHSSSLTDQNAMILPIDGDGSLMENCLPKPDPDEVSSGSAGPDFKSEMCYQGCANQSISWSCNGKVSDASMETLIGNWSHGELTMRNTANLNSSACSGKSSDPLNTRGFVDLLQTESERPCSSDSSVEDHSNDLGRGEVNVCSDIVPSLADSPFSVVTYPETVVRTDMASETVDLASNANFCVTSSELICASQPSASDSIQSSSVQEQLPETMKPALTPLPDFDPGASPEDPIIKEVFTDVQNDKEASSAPIVGLTELFPPISSRPLAFVSFPDSVSPGNEPNNELLSGSADGETRGNTMMGNLSPVSDLSETQEQWDIRPSEKIDAALSEFLLADLRSEKEASCAPIFGQSEILPPISDKPQTFVLSPPSEIVNKDGTDVAGVVSPVVESNSELLANTADREMRSNTSTTGNPSPVIDSSKTSEQLQKLPSEKTDAAVLEHKLIETGKQYPGHETDTDGQSVMFSGDECNAVNVAAVARDVASLDYSETQAGEADATTDHVHNDYHNDKNESLALDAFPFDRPLKLKMDSNSVSLPIHHDLVKVEDAENIHHEKIHEEPASVVEGFHQNEEELPLGDAAELGAQKHVDSVQVALENLNSNISSMPTDGSPILASSNAPSAGCVPNHGKADIVEAPLTNESTKQDVALNSYETHPLKRQEDNAEPLSNNLMKRMIPPTTGLDLLGGGSMMKPLHADELSSQSINYAMQIQGPPYCHGVASVSQLHPQSTEHTLVCFTEPMISTSVFPGNYMINNNNLATHNLEQPVYPQGFPILGVLPTEPQINLDSPPLPPLPPMQWRLSRFQNSSAATDLQVAPHVSGTVQSVPSTVSEMSSQNSKCEIRVDNLPFTFPSVSIIPQEGNQVSAEQGVFTQPTFHNTSAPPEEQALQQALDPEQSTPATVVEVSSHNKMNEIRIEDNGSPYTPTDGYVAQQGVATQPMLTSVSDVSSASNLDGIRREENLFLTASSSYQNGNQIAEESYQPRVNHHEREPLVEGNTSAHTPALVEVKANVESAVQGEPLEQSPRDRDEEVSSDFQLLPPSKIEPTLGFMVPESGKSWSSSDDGTRINSDGNVNGTLPKKPARPRNPLIDEVVAIDKTKLRKVERFKSSVESKPEGWGPLLEQMQLRKVERVNPPVERKVEEGKYEMEHLQLRKAGARANPQVELKTENRDSLLEQLQLRKVGERVKPEAEEKSEETESPGLQLREVGERTGESYKPEAEEKPVETESPRMLLRKVCERAHRLVRSKTEDRNSLLEQIKNKSFNLRPAALIRPSIQASNIHGPGTNLKVAAMLEKASNIRQAMAGSDEEDDADTWSDC